MKPQITVYIALSIDGYIARKDDSLDWLDRVGHGEEDYGFKKHLQSIDAVIMGRNTYGIASPVQEWPYTGKRTIVLSRTLSSVREGVELYQGDLTALIDQLGNEGIKHIWVDGGETISQFLHLNLVDRMVLSIIPIMLGEGKSLFHPFKNELPCKLISSQSYPSGLVQMEYTI